MTLDKQLRIVGLKIVKVERPLNFVESFSMFTMPEWMFKQTFHGITSR